jgi:NitT/TauT family transport system ATP-binding protein
MTTKARENEHSPPREESTAKIISRGVTREYLGPKGVIPALGPFDLSIAEGEFVCLVGPSGCGKSTFMRIVAGLLSPSGGELELNLGNDRLAPMSMVFQDYGIFPWKTVEANIRVALQTRKVPRKEATARARQWLERMGLKGFEDAYPGALSGGMRQRVAIARALAVEPEILLMDEPFAALDAQMRQLLQEELLTLCQEGNRTVLFVTHSLEEAILLGDRVVVMTARPGLLLDDKRVPFPRPRSIDIRDTAEFAELRAELWDHLRSQVEIASAGQKGQSS